MTDEDRVSIANMQTHLHVRAPLSGHWNQRRDHRLTTRKIYRSTARYATLRQSVHMRTATGFYLPTPEP